MGFVQATAIVTVIFAAEFSVTALVLPSPTPAGSDIVCAERSGRIMWTAPKCQSLPDGRTTACMCPTGGVALYLRSCGPGERPASDNAEGRKAVSAALTSAQGQSADATMNRARLCTAHPKSRRSRDYNSDPMSNVWGPNPNIPDPGFAHPQG